MLVRFSGSVFPVALAAVLTAIPAAAQNIGTWSKAAALPVIQSEWDGVAIGDFFYAVGGEMKRTPQTDQTKASDELWIYDAKADKWAQGPDMPGRRNHPAVAALDGMLYVFGGYDFPCCANYPWPYGNDNAWRYDPQAKTWKTLAPLPRKLGAGMAAAFEGKIYVFAGTDSGQFHSVPFVHEYDPAANAWRARASMRNAREHVKGAVVDSLIYVIGGHSKPGSQKINQPAVEAYSPRSNTWYDKGTMPSPRGGIGVAYLGGKIYAFGGEGADFTLFSRVDQFDPATGQWTQANNTPSGGIHGHATITWNGTAHLVAGNSPSGFNPRNYHDVFTPPVVEGCTLPAAPNFNRYATKDDGSCQDVGLIVRAGSARPRILGNDGLLRVEGLPPGRYRVSLDDPAGRVLRRKTFEGSSAELPWDVPRHILFLRIEGTADGKQVSVPLPVSAPMRR